MSNANEMAKTFTSNQVSGIVGYWKNEDHKSHESFKSLVRLGDSERLAVATVLIEKAKKLEGRDDLYKSAYYG